MLIHWFRRDLRLHDNTALAAAARDAGGAVAPVFIFDDAILHGRWASPNRSAFLLACLQALDADLRAQGSRLIVRRGDPHKVLPQLARELGASGVYWNRDYTPYAIRRDTALKTGLRDAGFAAESFKDVVVFEMNEVATKEGRPYTVYTPYARTWRRLLEERGAPVQAAPQFAYSDAQRAALLAHAQPLPTLADLGMSTAITLPAAGEAAAQRQLQRFVSARTGLAAYADRRNLMGEAGTSRLSPHLRLGTLSVRQCIQAAQKQATGAGADSWIGELIWRDFYVQVLYHHPHVLSGTFKPAYNDLAWENDTALFAAWKAGKTGYPVVDAAMRQLAQEGWMHNRARMIVASFLTKDLLIDWRWGETYFMQQLIDGDPAANNGGWQWAASTGTDAQPYFRIFNPASQGEKFDPEGAYVRRYVPELANVPNKYIHAPHTMAPADQIRADIQVGRDYPAPIVDHKERRERALALYNAVRDRA
jgi:deoxyribodipyrimidine photo-lyase